MKVYVGEGVTGENWFSIHMLLEWTLVNVLSSS